MSLVFIGSINSGNPPKGGEEYKNQLLVSKILENFEERKIIDTYGWFNKPRVWCSLILSLFVRNPDIILLSASSISTYRLLILIQVFRRSLMCKITYLVIGGYFPEGVRVNRFNWRVYNDLKNIIVQGVSLKRKLLIHTGLGNINVISNFKDFPLIVRNLKEETSTFKFVFIGRISQGKGIREILQAMSILTQNEKHFEIHFYGTLEEHFDLETDKSKYCGFLDFQKNPEESYSKLSDYDCMLFPTYWIGEGFPGVIIDAFIAGLPVIATDWNMNIEIIEDGINGFIIEPKSSEALAEKMEHIMRNREELGIIRKSNLSRAQDYHIDRIWPQIMELL